MSGEKTDGKAVPEFTEADIAKARAWFKKAADTRDRRDYDYAIECFITGLGFWPEAVQDGHMPLRSLAVQRLQAGGKKPGMLEPIKRPVLGRDPRQCMLNAEYLLAKDPNNASYLDSLLKNANKAGLFETVKWIAPQVFETIRKDKKPGGRCQTYRNILIDAAERADAAGHAPLAVWLLERAVESLDFQLSRQVGDEALRQEQRELSGKLAIIKGKYQDADSFRESLRDADQQKILHDTERVQQGEQTYEALIAAARKEWEQDQNNPQRINLLVEVLTRREEREPENEAIELLTSAHARSRNYAYKHKADDIRLRQLNRQVRRQRELAGKSGSEDDRQQARLAQMELTQTELEIYRERVAAYPTDLHMKYRLGRVLFKMAQFDDAIPVLQAAQADPRSRFQCQLLMGRAFFEKHNYTQAAEVLKELINAYELTDDLSKDSLYWLGRAHEAAGQAEEAKAAYGKLLRQDYNYADGDARKRLDGLSKAK